MLFQASYTTGAVYLAGYGVECILKALVLASTPSGERSEMMKSFRGAKAHEFEWLRNVYLLKGGARFPSEIVRHFTLVNDWSTDLRYLPKFVRADDAESFLVTAAAIIRWADGRLE